MSQSTESFSFNHVFARFASCVARWAGHPITFCLAVALLIAWAAIGPYMDYSTGWQLLVNTGTTICTFLMVFVIQNSQNRDGMAAQIKLDEIIRAIRGARNSMINLEDLNDEELAELQIRFSKLAMRARHGDTPLAEVVEEEIEERAESKEEKTSATERPRVEA
jgi:low affinity Fe/Cu permease